VVANKCTRCKGEGTVLSEDKLTIDVEKGSKNGEEILLPDMGDWGLDYDYGKLLLIVRESSLAPVILPMNATNLTALERRQNLKTLSFSSNQTSRDVLHSCRYRRAGDDLYVEYEISLKEALIGFVGNITHLDGHLVQVSRAGRCTHHGLVDVVYNEGMPKKDEVSYGVFGNMYVLFNVFFPKHLSDQQLAFVDQLFPPPLDSTNSTNTNTINNNNNNNNNNNIKTNGNSNNNNEL
jgi:DnaJ-class molecular chaperone